MSEIDDQIATVQAQPLIDVPSFTTDDAVDLGLVAVSVMRERGLNLAVRIVLNGDEVFLAKLKNTGIGNNVWLAGKAALVATTGEPSMLTKLKAEQAGTPFAERTDVDHAVVKAAGGSLPIRADRKLIGSITISGEPDTVDHATVSEIVRRYLASHRNRV